MTSDVGDRAVDLTIAATLALIPLLPAGPSYFGLDWPWALEAFFLTVAAGGLALVLTDRRAPRALDRDRTAGSDRLLRRGYVTWMIPLVAATVIGLLARSPWDLALWRVEAGGLPGRLAGPMNQPVDTLYPLRVGLTCLEGAAMFWLLSSLLRRTSQPGRRVATALRGCLWGLALVSVVAIGQYMTGANLHEYWVRANPDLTRTHATLDDPNALASFLVLGIGLALGVVWSTAVRSQRVVVLCVAALGLVALITTVSRAGWAGLFIAALVCAALLPDQVIGERRTGRLLRRAARGVGALLVTACVLWTIAFVALPKETKPATPTTPWEAAIQTVDPRESLETILKRRHLLWLAGIDLVRAHWILGGGLGEFPRFLASYPGSDGPENAHNFFLQILAEAGVIGLAGLAVLLLVIALASWPPPGDRRGPRVRLAIGLSMGLLAFVLTWLTGHPLLTLSNQLWLASVLAVGLARLDHISPEPTADAQPVPRWPRSWILHRAWLPVVATVTVVVAVPRVMTAAREGPGISYAAGVYAWESGPESESAPADRRFRWTRGRAALREPVGGAQLTIPLYLARPLPATLHATVGGVAVPPVTLVRPGWQAISYDLPAILGDATWRGRSSITLEFRVVPPFVPAEAGPSDDTRELGVGLGVIGWSGPRPK